MSQQRSAVLLIGSPRKKGTSNSLGAFIGENLESFGIPTAKFFAQPCYDSEEELQKLVEAVERSDIFVLSCPLYVDAPPAIVLRAFEAIADRLKQTRPAKRPQFMALFNCGFPESAQNRVALQVCENFAREAGLQWAGGIGIGMGGALGEKPLREAGGMARHLVLSLTQAAESLRDGKAIPLSTRALAEKRLFPSFIYIWVAHWMFKRTAKKNGVLKRLYDRPTEKTPCTDGQV